MSHLQHMAKKEIFQLINNRFIWPLVYNINAATIFPPPSLLVTLEACVPYRLLPTLPIPPYPRYIPAGAVTIAVWLAELHAPPIHVICVGSRGEGGRQTEFIREIPCREGGFSSCRNMIVTQFVLWILLDFF